MAAQKVAVSLPVSRSEGWLLDFGDRFSEAVEHARPPPFFAAERPGSAPNPLIQVCKQITGGSVELAPSALNLSLPLPPSQLKDLRGQGLLIQDERVPALEIIPRDSIAMINGKAWLDWIQNASNKAVGNNLQISKTNITLEFACVVNKDNNGSQLGGLKCVYTHNKVL